MTTYDYSDSFVYRFYLHSYIEKSFMVNLFLSLDLIYYYISSGKVLTSYISAQS